MKKAILKTILFQKIMRNVGVALWSIEFIWFELTILVVFFMALQEGSWWWLLECFLLYWFYLYMILYLDF